MHSHEGLTSPLPEGTKIIREGCPCGVVSETDCDSCGRCIAGIRPGRQRNHHGYGYRSGRSSCRRSTVEAKNTETGVVYRASLHHHRKLHHRGFAGRHLHRHGDGQGFKTYTPYEPRRRGGANPEGRRPSASRRVHGVGDRHRRSTLLKTETGELAHNVTIDQMDELPLTGHRDNQLRHLRLPQSIQHAC